MKTLVLKKEHQRVNRQSLMLFLMSILLISSENIYLLILAFPYLFTGNIFDKLIYLFPSIILLWINFDIFVQYIVYIALYLMLIYMTRIYKANINKILHIYLGIYTFSITYLITLNFTFSFTILIIQMILNLEFLKISKYDLKSILITLGVIYLSVQYMQDYYEIIVLSGLIYICFKNNLSISIASLFFINLYSSIISYEVFIYLILISILKDHLILMIIVYIGIFLVRIPNIYEILILGSCILFFILLRKSENINYEIKVINSTSLLNKQLHNFSLIFEHLATFYENNLTVESSFLESMANALSYISRKKVQDENDEEYIKNKIISLFEGYNIGYDNIEINIENDGFIRLNCKLNNMNEEDIKVVVLPLLNHILPTEMECKSIKKVFLDFGSINVEFVSTAPIHIDVYADSTQLGDTCGDSFSIFHHSNKLYCLISDGMGRGLQASRISKCIVHLFQRMIFSNIHEIEAMNCINKLLLSDSYATCDILIFNRFRKTVHICKSAANPTYLIRNGEMYVIRGNSLPIGIVTHIDVDNIVVHVEKGDLFIMSSDGVEFEEILEWKREYNENSARKEVEKFMEYLNRKDRMDDSTILLAKVV